MTKRLVYIAIFLCLIGIVGSALTFKNANEMVMINKTQPIEQTALTHVLVDANVSDIVFIPVSKASEARVELSGKGLKHSRNNFSITEQDGKLTVSFLRKYNKWIDFDFRSPDLTLKIFLPEKTYKKVKANGYDASIYVNDLHAEKMSLTAYGGDIILENTTFDELKTKTYSGNIALNQVNGDVKATAYSGDITITAQNLSYPIHGKAYSGDISIQTTEMPQDLAFDVKTYSGNVDLFGKYDHHAKIGAGNVLLWLKTYSGDITVEK